jgi:hypothetical protein
MSKFNVSDVPIALRGGSRAVRPARRRDELRVHHLAGRVTHNARPCRDKETDRTKQF